MTDGSNGPLLLGAVVAVVFVALYFSGRQHILVLGSAGATIRADVASMDTATVVAFIDQLEFAKNSRYFVKQKAD